jgi:hypothetical protein
MSKMKKTKALKPRIRQNIYGNWYGYLGNHRVESFFGSVEVQEEKAIEWLYAQIEMAKASDALA